ncbi:MAG: OmpA family protein [Nocardioides sp.]
MTRTTEQQQTDTDTRWAHKNLGGLWWAALVAVPLLLAALATVVSADPIASDLRSDSVAALESKGLANVDVSFEGRDATVKPADGKAVGAGDLDRALDIVKSVTGVRVAAIDAAATADNGADEPAASEPSAEEPSEEPPSEEPSAEPTDEPTTAAADPALCAPAKLARKVDSVLGEEKILFANKTTELVGDSAAKIDQVAALLADCDQITITVTGHTNPRAAAGTLSMRRAQVVADGLIGGGVDPALIRQEAVGDDKLRGTAPTEVSRALNRYADIGVN